MALTYNNIVVALDGSDEAEWALQKAIEIAKDQEETTLHLAHVVEVLAYPVDTGALRESVEKYGHELLEKAKKQATEAGVKKVNTIMEYGSPKVRISKNITEETNVDLIVCGATGVNAVERIFIGSVSEYITRTAKCDVLIVRTDES